MEERGTQILTFLELHIDGIITYPVSVPWCVSGRARCCVCDSAECL